jgi:hypothetical protein
MYQLTVTSAFALLISWATTCAGQTSDSVAIATYNPYTGEITITFAENKDSWYIESAGRFFHGPGRRRSFGGPPRPFSNPKYLSHK